MGALLFHDKASRFRARRTPVLIGESGASITRTRNAVTSIPRAGAHRHRRREMP